MEPISRFMIRLLVGYRIADFGRTRPGELAHRGGLVHFGDLEGAHCVDHTADDFAGGGICHVAHLAIDGERVAHLHAVLGADIDDDGAIRRSIRYQAVNLDDLNGPRGQRRRLLIQTGSHVSGRLVDGLAQDGVGEVGILHIERATAPAAGVSAGAQDAGARARLFAVALHRGQDLGGRRVDHARGNGTHGGGFGSFHAADSEAAQRVGRRTAADGGTLIVTAELGDAADDDGIDTENAGDLGGAGGVGAVAVGEILLRQDLVELFAFDDGEDAIVHQLVDEDVGNALADILIGSEHRGDSALYGRVIEVHHGDTLLLLGRCSGNQREAQHKTRNSAHRSLVAKHRPIRGGRQRVRYYYKPKEVHGYSASARATLARTSTGSGWSTRITVARGPEGRQRWNIRGAGKPAKMLISGTRQAAATCWPAES